jgi:hypothetical protein
MTSQAIFSFGQIGASIRHGGAGNQRTGGETD